MENSRSKSRRSSRTRAPAFILLTMILWGANGAFAVGPCIGSDDVIPTDTKVFPATFCRSAEPFLWPTITYTILGGVRNSQVTPNVVICPIVRDGAQHGWVGAGIVISDRHPNAEFRCRIHSANQKGVRLWTYNPVDPLPPGFFDLSPAASQKLHYGFGDAVSKGTFYLTCRVPGVYRDASKDYYSEIHSYYIREGSRCTTVD